MSNLYCVIMAGGIGSRFWPLSTSTQPKQFLDLLGTGKTFLQQTFDRFAKVCPIENIFVVTGKEYKDLVRENLPVMPEKNILCEPKRSNTAPCIAFASFKIASLNPDATIVVSPADHLILKEEEFVRVVRLGMDKAGRENCLVTLGIKPSRPDTGYGYIQFDERDKSSGNQKIKKVKLFTEKPDKSLAEQFFESGDFYWNSGIFIWHVKSILSGLEKHMPRTYSYFSDAKTSFYTPHEDAAVEEAYSRCKNLSIDYGVMEKADNVYMVLADIGWSDLGTWGSLFDHMPKDSHSNVVKGKNVNAFDASKNIIFLPDGKKAIIQGLEGYIIIDANNALLICRKEDEQKIRDMVNAVNSKSSF